MARVDQRFLRMLEAGFVEEVRTLLARPGLDADSSAMRAVGYRQIAAHLAGECDLATATARAQAATRQLAKRQSTWFRSLSECRFIPVPGRIDAPGLADRIREAGSVS